MSSTTFNYHGLSEEEVASSRRVHGSNKMEHKKEYRLLDALKTLLTEPMIILLLVTSVVYLVLGELSDGIFMIAAIFLVAAISLFQESRSRKAILKLKSFTQPFAKVIRNGHLSEVKSEDLVVGDYMVVDEGSSVNADAAIIQANDFSVNESILTGESLNVYKNASSDDNRVYAGTTVVSGLAIAVISDVGSNTRLGKIGKSLEDIEEGATPLEEKIHDFVKKMVIAGAAAFVIIWIVNFYKSHQFLDSLLKAMTLAMSILPEEIPVAFTTFMALGAWRMMKMGILVKKIKTVETLGSATVICTDKTGTLTENEMTLAAFYSLQSNRVSSLENTLSSDETELLRLAMWASEPIPFDPMEVALHNAYTSIMQKDERPDFKMIHEYPLGGIPPMMTHVFEDSAGRRIIAAKGAPEALMNVSRLSFNDRKKVETELNTLAAKGYRILGVAETTHTGNDFPESQEQYEFQFRGLVGFYDPPKKNIPDVLHNFYNAGIDVKIVTGDNAVTTQAIAEQIGLRGRKQSISGDQVMAQSDAELKESALRMSIFTRMFPEAKLRVINALKADNEIVAMTGDGINDGPALKAAHIGVAMGKKGTETARDAASLVLLEDDLSRMLDAVAMGRRIYANLKKAIQYIVSIHLPIILTVVVPLTFGWIYPNIFSPVHIIFFELIMGPTCSVIYENEPLEANLMSQAPRAYSTSFFNWRELATSVLQGVAITAGTLAVYQYSAATWPDLAITRTMVFVTLISANIILTLVNRSFYYSVFTTLRYKNGLVPLIIAATLLLCSLMLAVPPLRQFFGLTALNTLQVSVSAAAGVVSVLWYELVKLGKRLKNA